MLLFGLWYWELDRGGPGIRAGGFDAKPDFQFPQMTDEVAALYPGWRPQFVDYLYLSLTNATALSPTDTMPLSVAGEADHGAAVAGLAGHDRPRGLARGQHPLSARAPSAPRYPQFYERRTWLRGEPAARRDRWLRPGWVSMPPGSCCERDPVVQVDVFDRLMTPWGLVRFGVAPDHPKIKSVTRVFEKTARMPGFSFHGNVEVGVDVSHEELAAAYHAVLYAVGTPGDRRLGIEGEDLPGSESATEFVAWYNGHPDYADMDFDLSCKRAVVIGNGNVALDVARMLALSVEELSGDRHRRSLDRAAARLQRRGDRRARSPRPGAGGVHQPGAARAR